MSRIDELIQQMGPDGVEFREVGTICRVLNGYAFESELFNQTGDGLPLIRIRDVNTGFSETYYSGSFDHRYVVKNGDIVIGMDGDFRAVRWKHGRALLNQRVCRLQDFRTDVSADYVFYQIQGELRRIQEQTSQSTVKHLSSKELEKSTIPIPPLEVQRAIVEILDGFTKLEAELEAELEARRKQYAYYRETVLSLDSFPQASLNTLCHLVSGAFVKKDRQDESFKFPVYNGGCDETGYFSEFNSPANSVVISSRGANCGFVNHVMVDFWAGNSCYVATDLNGVTPRFLYHVLKSRESEISGLRQAGGGVPAINLSKLSSYPIPVPPLAEQERVVAILDEFDALVNDISVGLPAELAARRKQYEYYRDKLLTFTPLVPV